MKSRPHRLAYRTYRWVTSFQASWASHSPATLTSVTILRALGSANTNCSIPLSLSHTQTSARNCYIVNVIKRREIMVTSVYGDIVLVSMYIVSERETTNYEFSMSWSKARRSSSKTPLDQRCKDNSVYCSW